jgi:ABC-type multidrug transport system ATPase subunit
VLAALGEPDVLLLDEPYQGLDRAHDAVDRADAVIELLSTVARR